MFLEKNFYKNKKVFVTGHTGFKGSWLCLFLDYLGAKVAGYALSPDNKRDSLFNILNLDQKVESNIADIRDFEALKSTINKFKPEIIFHLAAQPLVRESYKDPIFNYSTNVMGTVNLFEATKNLDSLKSIVNITTDKCYENKEWIWPYRETDNLGGHDPYSASKACSEIITTSYRKSFFIEKKIAIASARAGNVIGGGDFSLDRIIPDIIQSIKNKQHLVVRNPNSIRPWQHVFDVLNGYLLLACKIYDDSQKFSCSFNFAPIDIKEITVEDLARSFISNIGMGSYKIEKNNANLHEAEILKLDASKAVKLLNWLPKYKTDLAINQTALWYKEYLNNANLELFCKNNIEDFFNSK